MTEPLSGLLLLDKPCGVTSFDCVHAVRRKLAVQRVGHCGTLDPSARGLLMILVGKATREQDSFLGLEKTYWFRAEFGLRTTTADLEGSVVEKRSFESVTTEGLEKGMDSFLGDTPQMPPLYSALKYQGKPYYYYARKGQDIPRKPRIVSIRSFDLLSLRLPYWDARVVCSRGTYVRTLVEDVAERLGTCATLVELVRERVGPYSREHALSWEELRRLSPENVRPLLLPLSKEAVPVYA